MTINAQATAAATTSEYGSDLTERRQVLLVEDDRATRQFVTHLLERAGHRVVSAASGEEALERVAKQLPDLVLMDLTLPGIDGYETTRRIKAMTGDQWVPVMFVTALVDDAVLRRCFDAGGDDFINKPVSIAALEGRMQALFRMRDAYRRQYREREELAYYRDMIEREQEMAKNIFRSIVRPEGLDLPHLRFSLSPMAVFNGDLLLVSQTPDGRKHLLVGDFTGHGLAASVGTLPTAEIFYAMSAKGFGIGDIMAEINRRLKALLPVGIFLAASGVEIAATGSSARVWNGGIPDLLVRRHGGAGLEQLPARHPPVAVLGVDEFDRSVDFVTLSPGDRLYLYTDGVIEAEDPSGARFGLAALRRIVQHTPDDDQVFGRIEARLEAFRAGQAQSDDVTLLEYTCAEASRQVPPLRQSDAAKAPPTAGIEWDLRLKLDPEALRNFDPRPLVTQLVLEIQGLEPHRQRLYAVIAELYAIAFEHGVLGLDPAVKADLCRQAEYYAARSARVTALQDGHLAINVKHQREVDGGCLHLTMTHSRWSPFVDDAVAGQLQNLWLLRELCDRVDIDLPAGRVAATYRWQLD